MTTASKSFAILALVGILLLVGFIFYKRNPTAIGGDLTTVGVKKKIISLGKTKQRKPVTASFVLTNEGKSDLLITDVHPDCHCTVARWKKEPVKPGDTTSIKATFDAAFSGFYQKNISLTCNAVNSPLLLTFRVEVIPEN